MFRTTRPAGRLLLLLALLVLVPFVDLRSGTLLAQEEQDVAADAKRLVGRLDTLEGERFWEGVTTLAGLGVKAVPVLREALPGLSPKARLGTAAALLALEEEHLGIETILAIARDEQVPVPLRIDAVDLLGLHATDEIEDAIFELLDSAFDPGLRIGLAKALWNLTRDIQAKEVLKATLKSTDPSVRIEGALALASIGDVAPVREILEQVRNEPTPRGRLARALLEGDRFRDLYFRHRDEAGAPSGKTPEEKKPEEKPPEENKPEEKPAGISEGLEERFSDELLRQMIQIVRDVYLDAPEITDGELVEAAARGITEALDLHSNYFSAKERADWQEDLNPVYGGIGSYVNFIDDVFTIVRPMFGGPAYEAKLRPGDQIRKVDGWDTTGRTTTEIVKKLRGEPGTSVVISVYRKGWTKPRDYKLERRRIHVPTVDTALLPGGVGYARLSTFARDSATELSDEVKKMESEGMEALILDLRYNSGGFLDTAKQICDLFLDRGKLIVYWEGRNQKVAPRRELRTSRRTTRPDYPVVILINGASASASEIVSGCLQYYGRAELVGLRSYGKGSVQNVYPIFVSPPAEPWTDTNSNGAWDPAERVIQDLNDNGTWDPGERYVDRNRNYEWDDAEPYEDLNGNGFFDYPAVKITIAKYYLPNNISLRREKKEIDGKIVWVGGVSPDVWVKPEEPDGWRNEELTRLEEDGAFDEYIAKLWEQDPELLRKLAAYDGGEWERYPGFEPFYGSLKTKLERPDVLWWLRIRVRRKVGDELGRELVGDYLIDQQLQMAVLRALGKLGVDPHSIPEFQGFAEKDFPEVSEDERLAEASPDTDARKNSSGR